MSPAKNRVKSRVPAACDSAAGHLDHRADPLPLLAGRTRDLRPCPRGQPVGFLSVALRLPRELQRLGTIPALFALDDPAATGSPYLARAITRPHELLQHSRDAADSHPPDRLSSAASRPVLLV